MMMSALMCDIAAKRIEPRAANAICNAGGKLLRIVELQQKYGTEEKSDEGTGKVLRLAQ